MNKATFYSIISQQIGFNDIALILINSVKFKQVIKQGKGVHEVTPVVSKKDF